VNARVGLDDVLRSLISQPAQIDPDALHRRSWNAGIDKAIAIVDQWEADRGSPEDLIERLKDAKIWTR
jgi:hypothetical protein